MMSTFTMGEIVRHKLSGAKLVFQRIVHREEGERALCESAEGNLDYYSLEALEIEGTSNSSIVERLSSLETRVAELEKAAKNRRE
jgi:hypothetical protein